MPSARRASIVRGNLFNVAIRVFSALLVLTAAWLAYDAPPFCVAPAVPPRVGSVALEEMFGGLRFPKPIAAVQDPRDPSAWLVVQARGVVARVRDNHNDGIVLDISDRAALGQQWGLQEIALHPRFSDDPRLFATYVAAGRVSRASAFRSSDGGRTFDPASEVVLLTETQQTDFHPIGGLAFGPDGYLYVGWGFGGLDTDDPQALRGKMLRIDVDHSEGGRPYAIPPGNLFAGGAGRPEIYARGLRNPWRFTFDSDNRDLWVGDVGEAGAEEVDRVVAGRSYGWPQWEGTACRLTEDCGGVRAEPPVVQHTHDEFCAVIGGYVYRGSALPELAGNYVYADACTGTIWALDTSASPPRNETVAYTGVRIGAFARGSDGELYVVQSSDVNSLGKTTHTGLYRIFRLVRASSEQREAASSQVPAPRLSETGCIGRRGFRSAPRGLIPYGLNAVPWEDGAQTYRFMTTLPMPPRFGLEESIEPRVGSILLKTYALAGRPVETQMLTRSRDGWTAFDYEWNEDATDAVPVERAKSKRIGDREWRFGGPDSCRQCHNSWSGAALGLTVSQLNRKLDGRNQIERLEARRAIVWRWKGGRLPVMARIDDESFPLEQRARAYLDVNCAHCHQPGGQAVGALMDLRWTTPLADAGICDAAPSTTFPGQENARLLAAGDPARSLIHVRLAASGSLAMPPMRTLVDPAGSELVAQWIRSMDACPSKPPA